MVFERAIKLKFNALLVGRFVCGLPMGLIRGSGVILTEAVLSSLGAITKPRAGGRRGPGPL